MIFNHNATQHSKRILFDKRYQNVDLVGEWILSDNYANNQGVIEIGDTIHLESWVTLSPTTTHYEAQIITSKPASFDKINNVCFKISSNIHKADPSSSYATIDLFSRDSNGNHKIEKSLYISEDLLNSNNGVAIFDVTEITGEFCFEIHLYSNSRYESNHAEMDIHKIWIT